MNAAMEWIGTYSPGPKAASPPRVQRLFLRALAFVATVDFPVGTLRKKPVLFSFFEETCIVFFLPTVKLAPPLSYLGGSERERESCICLRELALLAYFSYLRFLSFFNLSPGMEAKSLQMD